MYSSIGGHLAIVNSSAINMGVHMSLQDPAFNFSDTHWRSESLICPLLTLGLLGPREGWSQIPGNTDSEPAIPCTQSAVNKNHTVEGLYMRNAYVMSQKRKEG
jgi:hypothetical protein